MRPNGVIVVDEPGHALTVRDIERAIGAPVVAVMSFDPAIARAVDAGLLATRLPRDRRPTTPAGRGVRRHDPH